MLINQFIIIITLWRKAFRALRLHVLLLSVIDRETTSDPSKTKTEVQVAIDKIVLTDSFVCGYCETNVYISEYLESSVVEALILRCFRHAGQFQARKAAPHRGHCLHG